MIIFLFIFPGILTMIIVRTLRRDIAKYNKMDDEVRIFKTILLMYTGISIQI